MREVWRETKNPLVLYATEDALNVPRTALSGPLDRFVRAENKAFRQELNLEKTQAAEAPKEGPTSPVSPSKRKHRADSFDSMDSNRASIGSNGDNGFEEDPFAAQAASAPIEMTDMSELPGKAHGQGPEASLMDQQGEMASRAEETRGPEMQELSRPPAFMAVGSGSGSEHKGVRNDMDMDMLDQGEQ